MIDTLKPVQIVLTDYENQEWMVWNTSGELINGADAHLAVVSILDGGCRGDMVTFRDGRRFRVAPVSKEA